MAVMKVSEMTFEEAKKVSTSAIDIVLEFATYTDNLVPSAGFLNPIIELEVLKELITRRANPFLTEKEANDYLGPMLERILNWHPSISKQLREFFEAHKTIADYANKYPEIEYNLLKIISPTRENILRVTKVYNYAVKKIVEDRNEAIHLHGLFYAHILKTEVIEAAFRQQLEYFFKEMRKREAAANLNFLPCEIFSITSQVLKGNALRTDARAIRDSLTHLRYDLKFINDSCEIHFLNFEDGYVFDRIFGRDDFLEFLDLTDLLYKCTFCIIILLVMNDVVKPRFVK